MVTKTFDYWAIRTTDNECCSSDKEFFDTFADAVAARMNYANWYCEKGTCTIRHYRIGPDSKTSVMLDEVLLWPDSYKLLMYKGHAVRPLNSDAEPISDLLSYLNKQ